jgi:hypothetical protein
VLSNMVILYDEMAGHPKAARVNLVYPTLSTSSSPMYPDPLSMK